MIRKQAENRRYIDALMQSQRGIAEVVIVAIVLAFGINLLSSGLPQLLNLSNLTTTLAGIFLIAAGIAYLAVKIKPALSRAVKVRGVLSVTKKGQIVEIPRYNFSEEIHSYVQALTAENKALEKTWQKAGFGTFEDSESEVSNRMRGEGDKLVREAIEYFALNSLSLHLSAYFQSDRSVEANTVTTVQRRTIPQLLLDNRFLELFSKPRSERSAFQTETDDEDDENVVFAIGENGELFDQFELILPRGSTLARNDNGALEIRTNRFSLQLQPIFERSSENLPRDFEKYYLGLGFFDLHSYAVAIDIQVSFSWSSMFTRAGWDYYQWLDSFLEELDRDFEFDNFVDQVGWHTAHTVAITSQNLIARKQN